jgi:hypothetical protein
LAEAAADLRDALVGGAAMAAGVAAVLNECDRRVDGTEHVIALHIDGPVETIANGGGFGQKTCSSILREHIIYHSTDAGACRLVLLTCAWWQHSTSREGPALGLIGSAEWAPTALRWLGAGAPVSWRRDPAAGCAAGAVPATSSRPRGCARTTRWCGS